MGGTFGEMRGDVEEGRTRAGESGHAQGDFAGIQRMTRAVFPAKQELAVLIESLGDALHQLAADLHLNPAADEEVPAFRFGDYIVEGVGKRGEAVAQFAQ